MADLKTFRERVSALCHNIYPFADGHHPTQADLARAIGLTRTELSRRLHSTGDVPLSCDNARAIVHVLVG